MKKYLGSICCFLLLACQGNVVPTEQPESVQGEKNIVQARFEGDLIWLDIPSKNGEKTTLFTDTGGGNFLHPPAVEKLEVKLSRIKQGGETTQLADVGPLFEQLSIPPPIGGLYVLDQEARFGITDGMLGSRWFGDKIWRLDYGAGKLSQIDTIRWAQLDPNHVVRLGFQRNMQGLHLSHFPRIPIVVEGDTIHMLFDTGASTRLSDAHFQELNDGLPQQRAVSFIIDSLFRQWQNAHPDWRVLAGGDGFFDQDMIEVPGIQIGGHQIGPVWFARRDDQNFTEYMSQWMDQPIVGALGGSAFRYLDILLDYRTELAYFQKKNDK
ncbi:MAG: hypothetical protein AAF206_23830 [Bacteroidota bacterium]